MKRKILIVDDDLPIRYILKMHLRKHGFEVEEAENGKEALKMLSTLIPDVIVADIMMPEIDGYELCRIIRRDMGEYYRRIPFIFLTAKTASRSVVEGFRHGADDYITKPFDIAEVVERVKALSDKLDLSGNLRMEPAFSGLLSELALPDVLQVLAVGMKTGRLVVITDEGEKGEIDFREGFIVRARSGKDKGKEAVFNMLAINKGQFKFTASQDVLPEFKPVQPMHILLEGMRRLDESAKKKDRL